MGWGLTINNVYLSRIAKNEVKDKLDEANENVRHMRETIMVLAGLGLVAAQTAPNDTDGDPEADAAEGTLVEKASWLARDLSTLLNEYEDEVARKNLLSIADANPEDTSEG